MTFHLLCQLFSPVVRPQFCLIALFFSMSSRASMNSHLLSIRSSLSSAKETVHEKTDGLRWSDEDPAGRPHSHNLGLSEPGMVIIFTGGLPGLPQAEPVFTAWFTIGALFSSLVWRTLRNLQRPPYTNGDALSAAACWEILRPIMCPVVNAMALGKPQTWPQRAGRSSLCKAGCYWSVYSPELNSGHYFWDLDYHCIHLYVPQMVQQDPHWDISPRDISHCRYTIWAFCRNSNTWTSEYFPLMVNVLF